MLAGPRSGSVPSSHSLDDSAAVEALLRGQEGAELIGRRSWEKHSQTERAAFLYIISSDIPRRRYSALGGEGPWLSDAKWPEQTLKATEKNRRVQSRPARLSKSEYGSRLCQCGIPPTMHLKDADTLPDQRSV